MAPLLMAAPRFLTVKQPCLTGRISQSYPNFGFPLNSALLGSKICAPSTRRLPAFSVRASNKSVDSQLPVTKDAQFPSSENVQDSNVPYWDWTQSAVCPAAYAGLLFSVLLVPEIPRFQWSAPAYFLFLSVWAIYVGSHRSLIRKEAQELTLDKAWVVPVICSVSLFGFYCILRFFPDLDVRTLFSAYLSFVGFLAVGNNLTDPFASLFPFLHRFSYRFDLPEWVVDEGDDFSSIEISLSAVLAYSVGLFFALLSWSGDVTFTINNFIAVCIVTELLQLISLNSFLTASAMLCGLLIYDVFWVFGSSPVFGDNVMVTVATSNVFEGPAKLIFPQWNPSASSPYSILGLGDLAAPGLLVALMLRFDRHRHSQSLSSLLKTSPVFVDSNQLPPSSSFVQSEDIAPVIQKSTSDSDLISPNLDSVSESPSASPDKVYFVSAIVSYILGLILTIAINGITGAAQPALLYLVPSLLCGILFTSISRGELNALFQFRDQIE